MNSSNGSTPVMVAVIGFLGVMAVQLAQIWITILQRRWSDQDRQRKANELQARLDEREAALLKDVESKALRVARELEIQGRRLRDENAMLAHALKTRLDETHEETQAAIARAELIAKQAVETSTHAAHASDEAAHAANNVAARITAMGREAFAATVAAGEEQAATTEAVKVVVEDNNARLVQVQEEGVRVRAEHEKEVDDRVTALEQAAQAAADEERP